MSNVPARAEQSLPGPVTPADLLQMAVGNNADLDKLEKLMDLQSRWEATEARKAYHKAMSAFKADPPKIEKDRHVEYGNTKYNHATLAAVTTTIGAALSQHGLTWCHFVLKSRPGLCGSSG